MHIITRNGTEPIMSQFFAKVKELYKANEEKKKKINEESANELLAHMKALSAHVSKTIEAPKSPDSSEDCGPRSV